MVYYTILLLEQELIYFISIHNGLYDTYQ